MFVTLNQVTVGNCEVASGWNASVAHFYLGEIPSNKCAPGQWGGTFNLVNLGTPTTGSLGPTITRTLTRTAPTADIYVMLHMGVTTPQLV